MSKKESISEILNNPTAYIRRSFVTKNGIKLKWIGDERLDPNSTEFCWPIVMLAVGTARLMCYNVNGRAHPTLVTTWDLKEMLPLQDGELVGIPE